MNQNNKFNERIMELMKAFSKAANAKNFEFVTEENGYSYHVGYETVNLGDESKVVYFVMKKDLNKKEENVVKEITKSDYKEISKGKSFAIDFF